MHFGGTSGRLLLRCEDRMTLYEQQSRKVLAELQVSIKNKTRQTSQAKRKEGRRDVGKKSKEFGRRAFSRPPVFLSAPFS